MRYSVLDIVKMICIFIIGSTNAFSITLIFTYVFKNINYLILSLVLIALATVFGVVGFIVKKHKSVTI
jgi:hypothetical protein